MERHGVTRKADININHVSSSTSNPLTVQDMFNLVYQHFKSLPSIDGNGKPIDIEKVKLFPSMKDFRAHVSGELATILNSSKVNPEMKVYSRKLMEQAKYLAKNYTSFTLHNHSNTQRLMEMMSEVEKKMFAFDVRSIDWNDYIVNVHIPGLRRHVMKEKAFSRL
ncbi:Fatty acyl-CoA reductase [Corchorus olitorius]|uniref:Fatty acyl-CoA reductase n=1 Tax=Corchorus olitorius TaxID=93759 RepID=A0A1R3HEK6_9ROSI|nr:Fatty acyl-CoA reductase [Corchorus olitorius]